MTSTSTKPTAAVDREQHQARCQQKRSIPSTDAEQGGVQLQLQHYAQYDDRSTYKQARMHPIPTRIQRRRDCCFILSLFPSRFTCAVLLVLSCMVNVSFGASASGSALLSSLSLSSSAALFPRFAPDELTYSATLPARESRVDVRASPQDARATMFAGWQETNAADGQQSQSQGQPLRRITGGQRETFDIPLTVQRASLRIVVSLPPSANTTYTVLIIRADVVSHNAEMFACPFYYGNSTVSQLTGNVVASRTPANFSAKVFWYNMTLVAGAPSVKFKPFFDNPAKLWLEVRLASLTQWGNLTAQARAMGLEHPSNSSIRSLPLVLTWLMVNQQLSTTINVPVQSVTVMQMNVTAEDGVSHRVYTFVLQRSDETDEGGEFEEPGEDGSSAIEGPGTEESSSTGSAQGDENESSSSTGEALSSSGMGSESSSSSSSSTGVVESSSGIDSSSSSSGGLGDDGNGVGDGSAASNTASPHLSVYMLCFILLWLGHTFIHAMPSDRAHQHQYQHQHQHTA